MTTNYQAEKNSRQHIRPHIVSLLLFMVFVGAQNVHALDITGKEAAVYFKGEYSRNFLWYGDISTIGSVEVNSRWAFNSGFLFGKTRIDTDLKAFGGSRFAPWRRIPLGLSLLYIYNGLPEYDTHSHTILPLISYNARWAGVSAGTSFRFTSFFGEPAFFEAVLSLSVYANFINNRKLRVGIICANFSDFCAGNMGDYSIAVNSLVRINSQWSIINEIELKQSGSVALSATFSGIALKGGVKFAW